MSALGRIRDGLARHALGVDLRGAFQTQYQAVDWLAGQVGELRAELAEVSGREMARATRLRVERDDREAAQAGLAHARKSTEYATAFSDPRPLVTVRIPSYRKTEELVDVALASVKRQTYDNYEVVIVNDGPNDVTRAAIEAIGDPKITYVELPKRGTYPDHARLRWMVAGSPGMNKAVDLAKGSWIAPLDDDDEFTPDHLEKLIALAHDSGAELVYGTSLQVNEVTGTRVEVWSDPPAISEFGFAAAMYVRALHPTFKYDVESWLVNEPGDWNLARRMMEAGVTHASITDVIAISHQVPFTHKSQGD